MKKIFIVFLILVNLFICGCSMTSQPKYYSIDFVYDQTLGSVKVLGGVMNSEGLFRGSFEVRANPIDGYVVQSMVDTESGEVLSETNSFHIENVDRNYVIEVTFVSNTEPNPNPGPNPDPNPDPDPDPEPFISTISPVYDKTSGSVVTVKGVVTGVYGNNFYISDGAKGILIYMGNNSSYSNITTIGSPVEVTGTVDIYKDVHQIKSPTNIQLIDQGYNVVPSTLSDVSQNTLKENINDPVNVNNLVISSLPTYNSGSDYSFNVTLNGVEVSIFMSRHLDSSSIDEFLSSLSSRSVGDVINVQNAIVSKYNQYQLVVTNAFSLTSDSGNNTGPIQPDDSTYYSINLVYDSSLGTVTLSGTKDANGKYTGDVVIIATSKSGYKFEKMVDTKTGSTLSTNSNYTLKNIDRDYTISFYFVEDSTSSGENLDFLYKGTYYNNVNFEYTGKSLKLELRTLITDTHENRTTYDEIRYLYDKVDTDLSNSSNIILFYSGYSTSGSWNGAKVWNREHIWPQSLGWFKTSGAGSDLHHIRPTDTDVNSRRGNLPFGEVSGGTEVEATRCGGIGTGCYIGGGYFEPADRIKGDVARIIFYLLTRYSESDSYSITKVAQSMDMLLEWNELDPVDEWEMHRNNAVEDIQGNRNPFIDCSDLAEIIWG